MNAQIIPFNKPYLTGKELSYIAESHLRGQLAGDGYFSQKCSHWLEAKSGCKKALLTHSCTAALEMAAILANIKHGDEIIMPSYTFVSTANAFVLRGGVPVFVDIRDDTFNINELIIEKAITSRTKAIVAVHYGGVACEMDVIMRLSKQYGLIVIEDAAQGVMASYKGAALGSIGDIGCYSFHETKNIISGEGGAILINNKDMVSRAEVIREKGTNRSRFFRGEIDKYSWVDIGSSYLPGELVAAFLYAQMEKAEDITYKRFSIWENYRNGFLDFESNGRIRRRKIPQHCKHNAHVYEILMNSKNERTEFIRAMKILGISCMFHYVPLHSSPVGRNMSITFDSPRVTEGVSDTIVRLPLWIGIEDLQDYIISKIREWIIMN